ncbi:head maturation protease, ClpP-related [Agrobacterium tumefaciens]|uniref:head maturation protease, ClpP-related n=1 Tax=Agrobacterium tumefaciens TaxID=358 RepID=UPI003B9DEEA6
MSAFVSNGQLHLNGVVGEGLWPFDCFTYEQVMTALDDLDRNKKLTVHLNSPGGDAFEGTAIYAALTSLQHGVDIIIEGIAASAGSLIAMAGKTVTMAAGSVLMIHDVSTFTDGNSADHKMALERLETLSNVYAGIYASKTKKSLAACRDLMRAETWFEPQQAVTAGFADKLGTAPKGMTAAAFAYSQFQHAPKQLVDLATAKNWKAETTPPVPPKEKKMTDTPAATARAEASARIKAIMMHAEAEGRTALAQHLAYETDMEPEEAAKMLALAGKEATTTTQTYEQRRLAAMSDANRQSPASVRGLVMPSSESQPGGGGSNTGGLVANMKRRHGIK